MTNRFLNSHPKWIGVIFLTAFGIVTLTYLYTVKNTQNFVSTTGFMHKVQDPGSSIDTYNRGVYEHILEGFQFQYPVEIFTVSEPVTVPEDGVISRTFATDAYGRNDLLSIVVYTDAVSNGWYQEYARLKIGVPLYDLEAAADLPLYERPFWNYIKLDSDQLRNGSRFTLYSYSTEYGSISTTPKWEYSSYWVKDDDVIRVSISTTRGKGILESFYKARFQTIVDTFTFTN